MEAIVRLATVIATEKIPTATVQITTNLFVLNIPSFLCTWLGEDVF